MNNVGGRDAGGGRSGESWYACSGLLRVGEKAEETRASCDLTCFAWEKRSCDCSSLQGPDHNHGTSAMAEL